MKEKSQFASHTLHEHIVRGAVGLFLLIWAVNIANSNPLGSLVLGALMIFAFRGCPVCWLIGLAETAYAAICRFKMKRKM